MIKLDNAQWQVDIRIEQLITYSVVKDRHAPGVYWSVKSSTQLIFNQRLHFKAEAGRHASAPLPNAKLPKKTPTAFDRSRVDAFSGKREVGGRGTGLICFVLLFYYRERRHDN